MLNKKIPFFAMLMHSVFCMEYDTNVVNMSRNAELPEQMLDVCNYGISVDSRHNDSENINFNSYRGIINDDNDNVSINNVNITDNLVIDDNNLGRRMNFNICNSFFGRRGKIYICLFGFFIGVNTALFNCFKYFGLFRERSTNCNDLSNLCQYNEILDNLRGTLNGMHIDYCFGVPKDNSTSYKAKIEINDDPNCILSLNRLHYEDESVLATGDYFHSIKVIYSNITDLSYAFAHLYADKLDIYNIDMSSVVNITGLFYKSAINNLLGYENKRFLNVISFDNVFKESFFNHPLNLNWDVSIKSAKDSFKGIEVKNICIDNINTTRLTSIAGTFDSVDIKNVVFYSLDTQNVRRYNKVFYKGIEEVKINTSINPKIIEELESYNMICSDGLCKSDANESDFAIVEYYSKISECNDDSSFCKLYKLLGGLFKSLRWI